MPGIIGPAGKSLRHILVGGSCALAIAGFAVQAQGQDRAAKAPPEPESFYEKSGFEGRTDELSKAVMEAIRKAGPANGEALDFTPEQQRMLGTAVARAIKTIRNDSPYQHEMNDALVKAELTKLQFALDNDLLDEAIEHEARTQTPMLVRVGRMIREGGSPELAMIALTERTACFYHLVEEYERTGTTVRWKEPYSNVLAVTRRLGQHTLTTQQIHEIYTIPVLRKRAALMGMEVDISPLQADGWITMSIREPG